MLAHAAPLRDAVQPQALGAADGERQRVGGVARPAVAAGGQQQAHHAGDLVLVGAAAAGEHRQQGAARLGEHDERARVHAVEGRLQHGEIGPPPGDQLLQAAGEMGQPPRQVESAGAGEAAGVEGEEMRAALFDEAVAGMEAARIESQDEHGPYRDWASRTFSSILTLAHTFCTSSWSSSASMRRSTWPTLSAGTSRVVWGTIASSLTTVGTPRRSSSSWVAMKPSIGV